TPESWSAHHADSQVPAPVTRIRDAIYDPYTMTDITRIKTKTPAPYPIAAISVAPHDTKTFRFALPENATLDMLPGDHLYVHATIDGNALKRAYTPSSLPSTVAYFAFTT